MRKRYLFALVSVGLCGCGSSEPSAAETPASTAKQQLNSSVSPEQQSDVAAKLQAWDPKKDRK